MCRADTFTLGIASQRTPLPSVLSVLPRDVDLHELKRIQLEGHEQIKAAWAEKYRAEEELEITRAFKGSYTGTQNARNPLPPDPVITLPKDYVYGDGPQDLRDLLEVAEYHALRVVIGASVIYALWGIAYYVWNVFK